MGWRGGGWWFRVDKRVVKVVLAGVASASRLSMREAHGGVPASTMHERRVRVGRGKKQEASNKKQGTRSRKQEARNKKIASG